MGEQRYKKNWGKLFQVRLSIEEHKELTEWISKFGLTHRDVMMTVVDVLGSETVIKNGIMYKSLAEHAYKNGKYKKNNPDKCELCKDKYRDSSSDRSIVGHHHHGYDDENIDNVQWLCRRCYVFVSRKANVGLSWDEVKEKHNEWDGKLAHPTEKEES